MDFLKGIAIIAMVAGHLANNVFSCNILFNSIYSFHMPLLFFVSAYIEEQRRERYAGQEKKMLLKRTVGILLPYLSWSFLYAFFDNGLGFCIDIKNIGSVFWGYQYNGLWFLVVLYGLKITHYLYWKSNQRLGQFALLRSIMTILAIEMMVCLLAIITKQTFLINMLSYAIPYYAAVLVSDFEWISRLLRNEWITALAILLYAIAFPSFSFYDNRWETQVVRIFLSLCVIAVLWKWKDTWKPSTWARGICYVGGDILSKYTYCMVLY